MNGKQFALALIMLIGIGVFALPQTVALFAGQHSFYNIDATGNQVPCAKCHGDVKAELEGGGANAPHQDFKCEYCHRIAQGSSSGDNGYGSIPYTNATGAVLRVYLVPISDMEAGNVPATISGADVLIKDATLNGVKLQFGKGKLSAATADATLSVGAKNSWKLNPSINTITGAPLDTNPTTMNSGLDLTKAAITMLTARPYFSVNLTNAGSKSVNPGSEYHAASLVSCLECHGGDEPMGHYSRVVDGTANGGVPDCSNCHYGGGGALTGEAGIKATSLWAGGFGLTSRANDTGNKEAHNAWVKTDDGISTYEFGANNDACVACHTHVPVDITYNKKTTLVMEVTAGDDGVYTINTVAAGGSTQTFSGN